jgi:hypothetical protein
MEKKHSVRFDFVFFNHFEDFNLRFLFHLLIGWLFPYDWAGLFLQPWRFIGNGKNMSPGGSFAVTRLNQCRNIMILDETAYSELCHYIPGKKLIIAPDFADLSLSENVPEQINEIKRRANGRIIVGLFG